MKSVLRLAERLVKAPRPMRVVNFVDSNVVRCAVSKGRSSSRALNPTLQKFGATVLARGLYFTLPFLPTRLNTAEDPTRDREVRGPSSDVAFDDFSAEDMRNLALLPYMRRWISNWARITLVLSGFRLLFFCNGDRRSYGFEWHCFGTHMPKELATDPQLQPDHRFLSLTKCWISGRRPSRPINFRLVFAALVVAPSHGMLRPQIRGNWKRQDLRRQRPPLPTGRPVTAVTSSNRAKLFQQFVEWATRCSVDVERLLAQPTLNVE